VFLQHLYLENLFYLRHFDRAYALFLPQKEKKGKYFMKWRTNFFTTLQRQTGIKEQRSFIPTKSIKALAVQFK